MVNNPRYIPPSSDNPSAEERRIEGGPVYPLEEVKILASSGKLDAVTKACRDQIADLEWTNEDVCKLVCQLTDKNYHQSEWCKVGSIWKMADAYTLSRYEETKHGNTPLQIDYYIKFSLGPLKNIILVVRCHPQRI